MANQVLVIAHTKTILTRVNTAKLGAIFCFGVVALGSVVRSMVP